MGKNNSEETYLVCNLCKKRIENRPTIHVDSLEKEWWVQDARSYWTNKESGRPYCDSCINQVLLETELYIQET